MDYLLSLPENLVPQFHQLTATDPSSWFVGSDPKDCKVGSGGGTAYLLAELWASQGEDIDFETFLKGSKKLIIHAGGQSRRLPAYAPLGKILTPIPVFRWSRGQRINQTLLDLQIPLYEKILSSSGKNVNTLIASGDVMIHTEQVPMNIPEADVTCFGIWVDPHLASRHGVFFTPRENSNQLDFMLQKPQHSQIEDLASSHLFMMDIGVWLLSDKAVKVLMKKCGWSDDEFKNGQPSYYDIYSTFGTCLGAQPSEQDEDIASLSVAIIPFDDGEFYHYGTSEELITSTEKIQNRVLDQRSIWHHAVKQHPSLFVQNAITEIAWNKQHHHIWIENSVVPASWTLSDHHVITGIPVNEWALDLKKGMCLDIVSIGDKYCVRPYQMNDVFSGTLESKESHWLGGAFTKWLEARSLNFEMCQLDKGCDLQFAPLFPVVSKQELTASLISWMLYGGDMGGRQLWLDSERISADQISQRANLVMQDEQRETFRHQNLKGLAANYKKSVFYQTDLKQVAKEYVKGQLELPKELPADESPVIRFRDQMFRSEVLKLKNGSGEKEERNAFSILQKGIVESCAHNAIPQLNVLSDQIVWGRSPARLDLAGGWADTPPYCMHKGGSVVNVAVELNGQPPLQVFIRLSTEAKITLRSIDNGVFEVIRSFDELKAYDSVGSAFCIPRAALCLAGFHPDFCGVKYKSLEQQLKAFGGGFEISLLVAIPKGSGLGTSSILAASLLGVLSEFCLLSWTQEEICHRSLILEQLLTTGGGWQDQYGGILPGAKLLDTPPGTQEKMSVRWLPDALFTNPLYHDNWLLYYTGITRVAKNILSEIVRGMFLNDGHRLQILNEIKQHAHTTAAYIQQCDYEKTAQMVAHSWALNKALDSGTNSPAVQSIIDRIKDYTLGLKLTGAGGGGYMLICAKDAEAAKRIQLELTTNPPNANARFVKMDLSQTGFQVSRS